MEIKLIFILNLLFLSCNSRNGINKNYDFFELNVYLKLELEKNLTKFNLIQKYCMLNQNQRIFLNSMIRFYNPKKLLEDGAALGYSSLIMLKAIKDKDSAFLYSIDITDILYGQPVGFLVNRINPNLAKKWEIIQKCKIP